MQTKYEVIHGGLGSGKSTYALKIIDINTTFKLGVGGPFLDILTFKFGGMRIHEEENRRLNLRFKRTNLSSIVEDVTGVKDSTLFIDEWTTLFQYSKLWSEDRISRKIEDIFNAIDKNPALQRAIFISSSYNPYKPFRLYKRKAIWNKMLFKKADEVTLIEYGIALKLK